MSTSENEQAQERTFTFQAYPGCSKKCESYDGQSFPESQISEFFPDAEQLNDDEYSVNMNPNCHCVLEAEEEEQMIASGEYDAYWSGEEGEEESAGYSISPRQAMRGLRASMRSPEGMIRFGLHEALRDLAPELAPLLTPFLMPLLTVAFQEIAKYQADLQNQAVEKQRALEYRQVYKSSVSE